MDQLALLRMYDYYLVHLSYFVVIISYMNVLVNHSLQEQYFLQCNEDQIAQLLSALWIQVNLPDNLPANIEAMAHSFCLALISSRFKVRLTLTFK